MNTLTENMAALERKCIAAFGMGHSDMPDLTFVADLFEDGLSVDE